MGQAMVDVGLNNGKVLMLGGSDLDNNTKLVEQGFMEVMDRYGITIVDSIHATNWKAEIASDYVRDNPEVVNQVNGIMCGNDNLAAFAIKALMENRLGGKVCVVGQDADLEACQRIVEGTQYMTVYKPVEKLALEAAEQAVILGKDEPLGLQETFNDGTYDVPYLRLEPIAVTKDNMDEIITGKYHQKSEIYLNVSEEK